MGKKLAEVEVAVLTMGAEAASGLVAEVALAAGASCQASFSHAPSEVHLAREATAPRSTKTSPRHSHRLAVQVDHDVQYKAASDPGLKQVGLHHASLTRDTCL